MIKEFKQFLLRGNVVDLAVGVVVGASFNSVISALVADLLTPLIGALVKVPDFSGLSLNLNGSLLMYGHLLNTLISFLLVATAIFFFVIKPINLLVEHSRLSPPADPSTKKCPECLSEIPAKAKRCAHCSQILT